MDDAMFNLAQQAMAKAYAPYSKFRVGAVVRGESGALYAGCNVENAAFPEGCCAEAAAISQLVMAGEEKLIEAAVIGTGDALVTPCGGCRQRLREFADAATPIHVCGPEGLRRSFTLGELLPFSFGPEHVRPGRDE
ncbi:MAG: cytidine deaminase [Proteobacteria bacterium]|nr:cytidine deaminase [Pseudomonadota bacterium]